MEPPVAVAEFRDGKVTVWAPTQNPQGLQQTVAQALGLKLDDVTCHVTLLGGGFLPGSFPGNAVLSTLRMRSIPCGLGVRLSAVLHFSPLSLTVRTAKFRLPMELHLRSERNGC